MLPMVVLAVAIGAAYANGMSGPLVLDDMFSFGANESIRNLTDWRAVLWPPSPLPTSGRPILNLTFAVNHAVAGKSLAALHAVNVTIHGLAALVLFLTVRRVFCLPGLRERLGEAAGGLSAAVAMIWALHPIQTAAVTYVSQRAESLMGLFYLLTLYGFLRGVAAPHRWRWHVLAVISCWIGMVPAGLGWRRRK